MSSVTHNTFVIEKNYAAPVERVFSAFSDSTLKRKWHGESRGMSVEVFDMDFRVGGRDHIEYRFQEGTPFPGLTMVNDTTYQDIVPNRRLVYAYTMRMGENRISASLATFEFLPTETGTTLIFTEQGAFFEGADGPAMRQDGWRKLLERLAESLAG